MNKHSDRVEDPTEITEHDRDPDNVTLRAGYLAGMSARCSGDDRLFLLRASRSLLAYANDRGAAAQRGGK